MEVYVKRMWRTLFGVAVLLGLIGVSFVFVVFGTAAVMFIVQKLGASAGVPVDADMVTAALTAITIAGAAVGFIVSKSIEYDKQSNEHVRQQKREVYRALLGGLAAPGAQNDKAPQSDDRDFAGACADVLLLGSREVVERLASAEPRAAEGSLQPLGALVRAMRSDLGDKSAPLTDAQVSGVLAGAAHHTVADSANAQARRKRARARTTLADSA